MSIHIEKSIKINRSSEELYRFWRNFENLPRFMNHLESVKILDNKHSHWVTKAPLGNLGNRVEWDAEITDEQEPQFIAWRSLEGTHVPNRGFVSFYDLQYEEGTEVRVELDYDPPAGMVGAIIATLCGEAPDQQLEEDLWRLKQEIELGKTPLD
jgi:uncharacterized membrane protein